MKSTLLSCSVALVSSCASLIEASPRELNEEASRAAANADAGVSSDTLLSSDSSLGTVAPAPGTGATEEPAVAPTRHLGGVDAGTTTAVTQAAIPELVETDASDSDDSSTTTPQPDPTPSPPEPNYPPPVTQPPATRPPETQPPTESASPSSEPPAAQCNGESCPVGFCDEADACVACLLDEHCGTGSFCAPEGACSELPLQANSDHFTFYDANGSSSVASPGPLSNDSIAAGASAVATTMATERGGLVTLFDDGAFSYQPPQPGYWGNDSFEYEVTYGGPRTSRAQVNLTLNRGVIPLADIQSGSSGGAAIFGFQELGFSGEAVSVGDMNGDRLPDIAIAATGVTENGDRRGEVYIVFGRPDGFENFSLSELESSGRGIIIRGSFGEDQSGPGRGGRAGDIASAGDINGDGFTDLLIGVPFAGALDGRIRDGKAYVVFGARDMTGFTLGELDNDGDPRGFLMLGGGGTGGGGQDRLGRSVSNACDFNGDGFIDIVVAAPSQPEAIASRAGNVYIVFGGPDLTRNLSLDDSQSPSSTHFLRISGAGEQAVTGASVSGCFDFNGDGLVDVVVSSPGPYEQVGGGVAHVVYGRRGSTGFVDLGDFSPTDGFAISSSSFAPGSLGSSEFAVHSATAVNDLNGDGFDEVVVLIQNDVRDEPDRFFVVLGNDRQNGSISLGTLRLTEAEGFEIVGAPFANSHVSSAGDFNGDGFYDLALSVPSDGPGTRGIVHILFGSSDTTTKDLRTLSPEQGLTVLGSTPNGFPNFVSPGGDTNRDGFGELLIGASLQESPSGVPGAGAAYVLLGWNASGAPAGEGALIGSNAAETFLYSGAPLTIVDGGLNFDTLAVTGSGITLDPTNLSPRLRGIEAIDLAGTGANTLVLNDAQLRQIPDTSPGLVEPLAKVLLVTGNADDTVVLNTAGYTRLATSGDRRVFHKTGGFYGIEVSSDIQMVLP